MNTVPLYKTMDRDTVRPIGIEDCLAKSFDREVVVENKGEFVRVFEPEQQGMSESGGTKIVTAVRMLLEDRPDFIAVRNDMANAYNFVSRAAVVTGLEEEEALRHLAWQAATSLALGYGLQSGGEK